MALTHIGCDHTVCAAPWRHTLLPRQTRTCKRKTLVLDLDETLVHSSLEDVGPPPDFSFTVTFNQRDHNVQVRLPCQHVAATENLRASVPLCGLDGQQGWGWGRLLLPSADSLQQAGSGTSDMARCHSDQQTWQHLLAA